MSKKVLVAYFSHRGENYYNGKIVNLEVGNTECMAKIVAEELGADLFEIKNDKPYPKEYNALTDVAKKELNENARPSLISMDINVELYDIIFLGYPNWWGTMPMSVFTFLDSNNFKNKLIVPFCTHEGSGMGKSISDIKTLTNADVSNGIAVWGYKVKGSEKQIKDWCKSEI